MRIVIVYLVFMSVVLCSPVAHGQALTADGYGIVMSIGDAARIDYWSRKGIACDNLLSSLDIQIKLLEQENRFKDMVNKNAIAAQEEYRGMVERLAKTNSAAELQINELEKQLGIYKDRARRRGQALGIGAAVLGMLAYIGLKG